MKLLLSRMFCQECESKFPYFHTGIEYYIIIFMHGHFLIFSSKFNVSTTFLSVLTNATTEQFKKLEISKSKKASQLGQEQTWL